MAGCRPCGCGSTSPTTAPTSTAGPTQPGLRTVQGELEDGAGHGAAARRRSRLTCAGRTDTGVHARGQVVHLDVDGDVLDRVRRPDPAPARRRAAAPAQRRAAARRAGTPGQRGARRASTPASPRCGGATPTGSPTTGPRRPADPQPRAGLAAAARPDRDERGLRGAARASTTSRRSASGVRAPPRSARCSTSRWERDADGPGGRPRCGPTRSATTWSARWSAAWSPSARAAGEPSWAADVLRGRRARPAR